MHTQWLAHTRSAAVLFTLLLTAAISASLLVQSSTTAATTDGLIIATASPRENATMALAPFALAAKIDQLIAARWDSDKVEPAPPADDAEFLRRVYLDLAGKIPAVADVRGFFTDSDGDKRRKLVERLLESPTYATHFSNTFRDIMLPGANSNIQTQAMLPSFEAWLRLRLSDNVPYDRLVTELNPGNLVAVRSTARQPATRTSQAGPLWFRKMDRNHDGDVSLREYLGPREDFDRIDTNHDGLISVDESETAEKNESGRFHP